MLGSDEYLIQFAQKTLSAPPGRLCAVCTAHSPEMPLLKTLSAPPVRLCAVCTVHSPEMPLLKTNYQFLSLLRP